MSNPVSGASTEARVPSKSSSSSANASGSARVAQSIDGRGTDPGYQGQMSQHWPSDPRDRRSKPPTMPGPNGSNLTPSSPGPHQSQSSGGRSGSAYPSSSSHGSPSYHTGVLPPWSPTAGPRGMNFNHGPTELPPRPYGTGENFAQPKSRGKIPGSAMEFLPILEQRFDRLEGAVEGYAKLRAQQALDRSKIKGLEDVDSEGKAKKKK